MTLLKMQSIDDTPLDYQGHKWADLGPSSKLSLFKCMVRDMISKFVHIG